MSHAKVSYHQRIFIVLHLFTFHWSFFIYKFSVVLLSSLLDARMQYFFFSFPVNVLYVHSTQVLLYKNLRKQKKIMSKIKISNSKKANASSVTFIQYNVLLYYFMVVLLCCFFLVKKYQKSFWSEVSRSHTQQFLRFHTSTNLVEPTFLTEQLCSVLKSLKTFYS